MSMVMSSFPRDSIISEIDGNNANKIYPKGTFKEIIFGKINKTQTQL